MKDVLHRCLPPDWLTQGKKILIFGFEVFSIPESSFDDQNPKFFLQNDVFTLFHWGSLSYIKTTKGEGVFHVGHENSKPGCYCLIGSLAREEGPNINSGKAYENVTAMAGFLKIVYRQNFEKRFENIYDPTKADTSSLEFVNLISRYPEVAAIDHPLFESISSLFRHLDSLRREITKKKIIASLRWILSADDRIDTDSFIKHFLAVEMLGSSSSSTIIQDINNKLAKIYDIEFDEAKQFGFKKIDRLRGDVIHSGTILAYPIEEIAFLKALYSDILLFELELPKEYCLKKHINKKLLPDRAPTISFKPSSLSL